MWQTANKKRCYALLYADRLEEALESYRWMMNMSDENTKASCLDWCTGRPSVMMQGYNPHLHFTQPSSKNAGWSMLQTENLTSLQVGILPSLQGISTGLSSSTRRRLTSIAQLIRSSQNVVRRSWGKCYGRKRSSMHRRCDNIYPFIAQAYLVIRRS